MTLVFFVAAIMILFMFTNHRLNQYFFFVFTWVMGCGPSGHINAPDDSGESPDENMDSGLDSDAGSDLGSDILDADCQNLCAPIGKAECAQGKIRFCQTRGSGCPDWSTETPCPDNLCADSTSCVLDNGNYYFTYVAPPVWDNAHDYDMAQVLSAVQAILNQEKPTLFFLETGKNSQRFWLTDLQKPGNFLADKTEISIPDFEAFIQLFAHIIDGAVVWGEDCWATKNAAVTAAGADGRKLIILRKDESPTSVYSLMTKPIDQGGYGIWVLIDLSNKFTGQGEIWDTGGIPSTGSKKCDAYKWALSKYVATDKVNAQLAAYRLDGYWFYKTQVLGQPDVGHIYDNDYLISQRAFVFDLDPWPDEIPLDDPAQSMGMDHITMRVIYEQLYSHANQAQLIKTVGFPVFTAKYSSQAPAGPTGLSSSHLPWQTEWKFAEIASNYNSYMESDIEGTMNTSFYRHIPKITYKQEAPSGSSKKWLFDQGYLQRDIGLVNNHYVLLTSSDFDAVSWMEYFLVAENLALWLDQQQGNGYLPIAWAFNPQQVERIPNIFNYLYSTRTSKDFFVGADSAAGYINPTFLITAYKYTDGSVTVADGVTPWIQHNQTYYQLLNYRITNNLINGNAGALTQREILDRLTEFSPDGVTIVNDSRASGNLENSVPVIAEARSFKTGIDQSSTADVIGAKINEELAAKQFCQFRTILIKPSVLKDAIDTYVRPQHADVQVVDPYTFFELLEISLGKDIVPPACNFQINNGAASTASPDVQLGGIINHNDYPPNATGVVKVRFSNDAVNWQEFDPPTGITYIPWRLSNGAGSKIVYMQAKDGAGNWGNMDSAENFATATILVNQ